MQPSPDDVDVKPWLAVIGVVWVAIAFALFRIIIPALVNRHNDGLLILAFLLPIGFGLASYYLYRFIKENMA